MNSADRVIIRPLNQRLNSLLYIYYSNYMSGINTHYKPAVSLIYFSGNVSLGCLLDLLEVLITQSPTLLGPGGGGDPESRRAREGYGRTGTVKGPTLRHQH